MYNDTIAAIATPPGQGGIGIVRLSGRDAKAVAERLFPNKLTDHYVTHGHVRDPKTGEAVDEALVVYMAAPRTYTKEDTVEISCHGSPVALQRVLALALEHGARLAHPGEFTLRAFLNGRLDLAQAEAVLDIIQAQNDAGLRLAVAGLGGRLSEPIHEVYHQVLQVQAYLTACIDFPEDEVEAQIDIDPKEGLAAARETLYRLLESADAGIVYRQGVRTAIIGRPNVGKSSLLNRLLGEERAIVTDVPGTTRDTVEEVVTVKGIPFHLIDTAGIQDTEDVVEHIGIERSRKAIGQADLVILVVDASAPLTDADRAVIGLCAGKAVVTVANKSDLPRGAKLDGLPSPVAALSALTGAGIESLHEAMAAAALGGAVVPSDAVLVTNPRHKAALERALSHLESAERSLEAGSPEDFVTIDLTACLSYLGQITGQDASEELLETIFRQFCIGK